MHIAVNAEIGKERVPALWFEGGSFHAVVNRQQSLNFPQTSVGRGSLGLLRVAAVEGGSVVVERPCLR